MLSHERSHERGANSMPSASACWRSYARPTSKTQARRPLQSQAQRQRHSACRAGAPIRAHSRSFPLISGERRPTMRDTLEDAARWLAEGRRVAQATVVSLVGSAPRGAGATLVVSDAGDIAGSVSNGCVEPDVVEQAQRVMRSGKPRLLTYGVSEEQNYERIGLSCGGEIRVFIERVTRTPELEALEGAQRAGRPAV